MSRTRWTTTTTKKTTVILHPLDNNNNNNNIQWQQVEQRRPFRSVLQNELTECT